MGCLQNMLLQRQLKIQHSIQLLDEMTLKLLK